MLNRLYDAMTAGRGAVVLEQLLVELVQFAAHHFETERRLMETHDYHDLGDHDSEHRLLTRKAAELKERYDGGKMQISLDVLLFLKNWLSHHIMGTDKQLGTWLNGKGVH
jgi:hemerythrin-like metal-binding protein